MEFNENAYLYLYFNFSFSDLGEYFGFAHTKDKVDKMEDCPCRMMLKSRIGKDFEFWAIKNKPLEFNSFVIEEYKKIISDIRNSPKRLNEKLFEDFCVHARSFTTFQDICSILHKTPEELTQCIQTVYPQHNAPQYLDIIYKSQKHLLRQEQIKRALGGDSKMLISVGETYLDQKVKTADVNVTISISKLIEQERKVIDAEFEDITNQKKLNQLP